MKYLVLVIMGWLALAAQTQAASFDCKKAKSKMEHAICNDAELSKADEVLGAIYKDLMKALEHDPEAKKRVQRQQKEWLKKATDDCREKMSSDCLKSWYDIRLGELGNEFPGQQMGEYSPPMDDFEPIGSGVYRLEKGKGFGLCEELFKRLTEQQNKNTRQDTQVCELNVLRSIPGGQFPFAKWKKLDFEQNELLYIKLLLLSVIKGKNYKEVVEKYLPRSAEKIESISIPYEYLESIVVVAQFMPNRSVDDKSPLKGSELERAWHDAITEGYSLYLGDASDGTSKESGPVLIEAKGIDSPDDCPRVRRIAKLPDDPSMAKMLDDGGMLVRTPMESIRFKFNKHPYTYVWMFGTVKSITKTTIGIDGDGNERCEISIY